MAINNKTWWTLGLFSLVLMISFAIAFKLSLSNRALTPNAPESKPQAGACVEQCPGPDGIIRSCTPPEADGSSEDSGCLWKGRVAKCGGKDFCCPADNGAWTNDMTACCVDTTWTPDPALTCSTAKVTQTSNCGKTKEVSGTKTCACVDTTWTPDVATKCINVNFVQTSNCSATKSAVGTKTTDECAVACVDTTWTPDPSTTCTTAKLTQTSNCGKTKEVSGTKDCCVDTTWTPSKSGVCADTTLTQTSNCGNEREVDGIKVCSPNITISVKAYLDSPKNKPGEYFIDKQTTKISRDQFMVYNLEVKNTGTGKAKNLVISDTLTGQNQSILEFVDSEDQCTYDYSSKKLSCEIDNLEAKGIISPKFRVKTAQTAINGKVIRNTAKVVYGGKTNQASVDVLVSSIVKCNEFCNSDSECVAGLACDVFSSTCRKAICSKETSCSCAPTATITKKPTATLTVAPTDSQVDFPDSSLATPTIKVTEALAENTEPTGVSQLPETGVLDNVQTTVFGGGLLLAILGLFLAL